MRGIGYALATLGVLGAVADAKPLPKGLTITSKNNALVATENGVSLPLFEDYEQGAKRSYDTVTKSSLSDDGKNLLIETTACGMVADGPVTVPLARVEARFENYAGMASHLKKAYPDAITHFDKAVSADPTWPLFLTNLLSAQSMGGKLDDADKTIAAHGKAHLAWLGWRLAVDSDLVALKTRASVTKLFSAPATKIDTKRFADVAVSPLGLVAIQEKLLLGMGGDVLDEVIYDRKTGAEVLRLPLIALADQCFPDTGDQMMGNKCTKANLAHDAAHATEVAAALAFMGFQQRKTTWTDDVGVAGDLTVEHGKTAWGCGGADQQQTTSTIRATK